MTIYAAAVVDTPGDPFAGDPAATLAQDGALLVRDGVIAARGSLAELRAAHAVEPVTRLDGGLLLPGFVDTHVHFPQIRAIGRLRYAVTPRFSLSASDEMLDACAQLLGKGVWFTSHINENLAEIATVAGLFPGARHYLDTYCRHGLVTPRSVFAHNVHPGDAELTLLAERGASVAHCPTSNSALGSGLFPLRRHVEHGVRVALGSDVGAGSGLFLPKEALQAYFIQQLLGPAGMSLTPVHLLYLATRAGARALGLEDRVGDLAVGKYFDAVWLRPADGSTLAVNLRHARDTSDALARIFTLATPADVAGVWVRGLRVEAAACPEPR